MAKTVTLKIPLEQLKTTFFVRKKLNEDHVLTLADLYQNGTELPPLDVFRVEGPGNAYEVGDGRHRLEALVMLDRKFAECRIVEAVTFEERVAFAMKANVGGALPPTREDIEHTMVVLLEAGTPRSKMFDLLPFPKGMVKKYIDSVQSTLAALRMRRALEDLAGGTTSVKEAADKHKVDYDSLKARVLGRRRGGKKETVRQLKTVLETRMRSLSNTNVQVFKKMQQMHEDDEISTKDVLDIYSRFRNSLRNASRVVDDWQSRFENLEGKTKGHGERAEPGAPKSTLHFGVN